MKIVTYCFSNQK